MELRPEIKSQEYSSVLEYWSVGVLDGKMLDLVTSFPGASPLSHSATPELL
jgi:hypothetical protein